MDFKYFEKADKFIGFKEKETICDCCGESKVCFDAGGFRGKDELNSVCPECLRNGKLDNYEIYTCNGDIEELERQIKKLNLTLSDFEVEKIANSKTKELEITTPHLSTWQDWLWPCADGDYCKFIGYGSSPLYNELSNNNGKNLFKESIYYDSKDVTDADYLWDNCMPNEEIKNYEESSQYRTVFYVFRSLNSDTIITVWDCD